MATDGFKGILFGLVLFTLFASLMVYTAVQLGENYGVSSDEVGGGSLNDEAFAGAIDDVQTKSENYRARFESGDVDDVDDVTGVFSIVTDMISLIIAPFTLLAQVLDNILGVPPMVTSVVLGLLGIGLILGIWSLLKKGD